VEKRAKGTSMSRGERLLATGWEYKAFAEGDPYEREEIV